MKIAIQFTALTFIIPIVTWVISALFGLFGFTIANAPWLCVLFRTISSAVENTRFGYSDSLFLYVLSASILIVVSIAAVLIYERNVRRPNIDGGDAQ